MKEFKYLYSDNCWFKGVCNREQKIGCNYKCPIQPEFSYLLNTSNIPQAFMKSVKLYPETVDYNAFVELNNIKGDIEQFVKDGRILYLWGASCGVGKSQWVAKLLKSYLATICIGNNYKDRAWFEYVPTLLLTAKNFDEKEERKYHIENTMYREFVILDDIGAVQNSNYDLTTLSSIIDYRYSNNLATLFTSNISTSDLSNAIGTRLADRVLSDLVIELKGGSRREYTNKYVKRGDK